MARDEAYYRAEKRIKDAEFSKASFLYLSDMGLSELPEALQELRQLQVLKLSYNYLTDLPPYIAQFRHLTKLELDNNPLNPELSEAYDRGLDAVKAYLQAKANPNQATKLTKKTEESLHKRKLKVFLCHASQDKPVVHELYQRLITEAWIEPWLDAKKLLPGQDWQAEIKNAVETADNVIIFLSNTSINKDGFIQKELRLAKEMALEKTEGSIFLIPLRLDDCAVPRSLQTYQWTNYFGDEKEQSYSNLLTALKLRLQDLLHQEAYTK